MKQALQESLWVQAVKTLLLSLSAFGYTWLLVDGSAHAVVVGAVWIASLMALLCAKFRVRTIWCVFIAAIIAGIGIAGSALTLNKFGFYDVSSTITLSRFWYYSALVFGIVFLSRSLALRWRTLQIIEAVLIIGTLVYLFFEHRDFKLTQPRDFADYLYSNGYNPIDVYRWFGVGVTFLSLPMLFGKAKLGRAIYSIIVLAIIALFIANLAGSAKLHPNVVDPLGLKSSDQNDENSSDQDDENNDDDDSNNDDENNDDSDKEKNGGGNSDKDDNKDNNSNNNNSPSSNNNNNPVPVAVAVFYDEYSPSSGYLYFRQNVLSEYDGNHLVASAMDDDVISSMPVSGAAEAAHIQNETMHSKISTSMFLMQDHAQPPQLAMGQRIFTIQNPDPSVFVSAYGVESVGLTIDPTRLIGRHSIPENWTDEKRAHYLKIPDDPRYRALSDIIVRQIDPRFAGDDIVKALYIKSWLEKEGFYTQKTRHIDAKDPTASFLFGSLRGYCVHFAHSAALLFRSQGIASRVAIGYAVDNQMRGTNSAVLIMGNQAHAWPEIYVDSVGWVTLDIYPENGDEPPRAFIDRDLESLFGELARDDKSGGKAPESMDKSFEFPWPAFWLSILGLILAALLALYIRKIAIIVLGRSCQAPNKIYRPARAAVFTWAMYGHHWRRYDSLESFARAEAGPDSATSKLISLSSGARLGANFTENEAQKAVELMKQSRNEAAQKTSLLRKILGWINPFVRI